MSGNKFVAEFSVTEAVAVKQLKEALPDILTTVFGSDDVYTLWGVPLDVASDDERLLVVLIKFLRENELDIAKAKEMIINTLTWRKEMAVDNIFNEEFDKEIFSDNVGCVYKTDKENRPVIYNFYGGIDQDKVFGDIDRFIRWRIRLMEDAIRQIDFINTDATTQVHDYNGASIFGRTANTKEATNKLIQIMKDYYPGFLEAKLFVNVPWWGSQIYKLLSPLLSEATLKRFTLCSSYELEETLLQHIDRENWPPIYQKSEKEEEEK